MRRSRHADAYARTLVTGRWPSLDILPPPERAAAGRRIRERAVDLSNAARQAARTAR
jgi:hypothetical protein